MAAASRISPDPRRRAASGFTLIELMIVIALIGILAAIALPAMRDAPKRAKEAVLKEDLFAMRSCIDQFLADRGTYPGSLNELVTEGYLRFVPNDPITGSAETWVEEFADPEEEEDLEPNDDTGGPGLINVRSGAGGLSLDGTPYGEW